MKCLASIENIEFGTFTLAYDAKNRLVTVTGAATASFTYDGDGKQVKSIVGGVTTYYVGQHYEKKGTTVTKYYFAGTTRLAVRTDGTLSFLLGDYLGSSSVTTNASGVKTASALYKAFGETRYTTGNLGTDYKFTGQREQAELGLYFYGARWYDGSLGRFISPDTIVPTGTQGTQAWDRYAYVNNNPVRYNDPTGHMIDQGDGGCGDEADCTPPPTCTTVFCKALNGDVSAIADLIFPTHAGWRNQMEVSVGFPGIAPGVSGTVGWNGVFNRRSGELSMSLDITGEGGVGASAGPGGVSITGGPLVGWGSSTTADVTSGTSLIVSGTASPDLAVSGSAAVPLDGYNVTDPFNFSNVTVHVDPVYGIPPVTLFGGVGFGTPYAGIGVGLTQSAFSTTVNLFPWNWQ